MCKYQCIQVIFSFLVATFKISPGPPHPSRPVSGWILCSGSDLHADQMPSQMPQPFSLPAYIKHYFKNLSHCIRQYDKVHPYWNIRLQIFLFVPWISNLKKDKLDNKKDVKERFTFWGLPCLFTSRFSSSLKLSM